MTGTQRQRGEWAAGGYFHQRAQRRAGRFVRDPEALRRLAEEARARAERPGALRAILDRVLAGTRMARAYATGEYRAVRFDRVLMLAGGLLYLVSPFDMIPDFLPGGFLDDAAVLTYVLRALNDEIDDFLAWERARTRARDDVVDGSVV